MDAVAPIILIFAALLWFSIRALRRRENPPFISGLLIGSVIGCLLFGLCSSMVAVGSSGGLNFH